MDAATWIDYHWTEWLFTSKHLNYDKNTDGDEYTF